MQFWSYEESVFKILFPRQPQSSSIIGPVHIGLFERNLDSPDMKIG